MKRTASLLLALLVAACATTDRSAVRIHDIQGAAHRSPLEGQRVESVAGIVTAVLDSGRNPGFWMQDARPDANPATSEALFVSAKGGAIDVRPGDAVEVSGQVEEIGFPDALTTTQITNPTVRVADGTNPLPAPFVLDGKIPAAHVDDDLFAAFDPREDAIDFWESLEGMRVEVREPVVAGGTSGYGDLVVLAGRAETAGFRGGVVLRDGDVNPERIIVEPRLVANPPAVHTGDRFAGSITGVVDYNFGNYRLLNTTPLPNVVAAAQPPERTALTADASHLTVATYNVLNLSAANDPSRFTAVAQTIAVSLGSPDVIGVQEIQDDSGPKDDGVVTAQATFGKLIEAVVAAGGPRYEFRQIDPRNNEDGGQPGGNIRVGILFNPARVSFVERNPGGAADATALEGAGGAVELTRSPGRIEPANPCFAGGGSGALAEPTRKSLAAEMQFGGRTFFLVVNHLKSKRGDTGTFGAIQPPEFRTEEQRTCQAEIVGRFAASLLERNPDAAVIVAGDMNEHEFRRPMRRLAEVSGLVNLIERVPVEDRYTYSFEGNLQVLDHIFVSPALARDAVIDIVHTNADRADSTAASDHDPVVVRLAM